MKRNEGFTMVELLVAMVVGSIVTLAATSVLLLGLRYNAISIGAAQRQNTTRIIMSLLEGVASEGQIKGVESRLDSWKVLGEGDTVFASYHSKTRTIYANSFVIEAGQNGEEDKITGTPLLEGVLASHVSLAENGLLTVSVETEDGSYVSSIYCRNHKKPETDNPIDDDLNEDKEVIDKIVIPDSPTDKKDLFLKALLSQYPTNGMVNPGVILGENFVSTSEYYAQWYIGSQNATGWDSSTPWCACYISWALVESDTMNYVDVYNNRFAYVDDLMGFFTDGENEKGESWSATSPVPGDLVFFDWEGGNDPEHVGVVLLSNDYFIYTIEGNSAGLVAMRMYSTSDPAIIGYGKLNFQNATQSVDVETLKDDILAAINVERQKAGKTIFTDHDSELDGLADAMAEACHTTGLSSHDWSYSGDDPWVAKGAVESWDMNVDTMIASWISDTDSGKGTPSSEIIGAAFTNHCGIGVYKTSENSYYIVVLFAGNQ